MPLNIKDHRSHSPRHQLHPPQPQTSPTCQRQPPWRKQTWRQQTTLHVWSAQPTAATLCASCVKRYPTAAITARQQICMTSPSQNMATDEYTDKPHSMTHRQVCSFKQRSLDYQNLCAVCTKPFSETNVPPLVCTTCFGIKYCSRQCQRDNQ
jgi:hypothetical protein